MIHAKFRMAALFVAALALVGSAAAQTVDAQLTGSSGVFLSIGQAAFNDVAGGAGSAHIWSAKGNSKCTGTNNCAAIHDSRSASIPDSQASVWVVWDAAEQNVWTYSQVDTIVGNRAYFATPRASLVIDSCATTGACPGQQLIPASVLGGQLDDASIPIAIYNKINNLQFTALVTELRPEDAAQEQKRVVGTLSSTLSGLGYGTGANTLIGTVIESAYDSATANPTAFKIKGVDPFPPHKPIPTYSVQNLGAYPIVFVSNRTSATGLGLKSGGNYVYTNLSDTKNTHVPAQSYMLQRLMNGDCEANLINPNFPTFPVTLVLREPLSGTYTTTEYTEVRNKGNTTKSMEGGVGQPTLGTSANPLNKPCTAGGGTKIRGIGTGEVLKGNGKGTGGVLNTTDSLAYFFWSFANGAPFAGNPSGYGYFTLDGVDPLQTTYVDGTVPSCTAPCPVAPNTSFPHLRDGTYRSWTIVRVVGTAGDANLQTLVNDAQCDVNNIEPDFVPWTQASCSGPDTGLGHYRSHFTADSIVGSNVPEAGGDVGGAIFPNPPDNLAIHLNKKQ